MGYEEAEKFIQATEESKRPNKKWSEAQEAIKQNYSKYAELLLEICHCLIGSGVGTIEATN